MVENQHDRPLLSVIIPCYNCAPVVGRCLDSIDYAEAEIIVVNDGSTDDTVGVVGRYVTAHAEKNIRLLNKPNGGVSSARNMGLDYASGTYIMFVDADDYVLQGGISRMVSLIEEKDADFVLYHAKYVDSCDTQLADNVANTSFEMSEVCGHDVLKRYDIPDWVIWLGLFRNSVIKKNDLRFKIDLPLHEDDVFMGMFFCHADKVVVTNLPLYCYVRSSDYSSTHRQSIEKLRALIDSGWKAAAYRKQYVASRYPEVLPLERLKYMRWVCQPKRAKEAGYSLREYQAILAKFKELEVYPIDYRWIGVAHTYASTMKKMKYAIKTFLTNHPRLGYWLL